MNILHLSASKADYIPSYVNATSVNPSGNNPSGWNAKDIVDRIMGRKSFAPIPIELFAAISEASFYGEYNMAEQLRQSLHNLQGSILLDLKAEAKEGTLAMEWIKNRLLDFPDAIPNYVPFIPPIRHPENIRSVSKESYFSDQTPIESTEETINQRELAHQAKIAFMSSIINRFDQSLKDALINLGTQGQTPQSVANQYEQMLSTNKTITNYYHHQHS
ncbi:MAG: hypothetical protein FWB88_06000 [Defluviitaleaceae bacterium]|nr:hypothetical protein [Defluviitaleaceae bacterium]MCL2240143.1 hypothetical protein [Defluviitaleaceae bacterium]